jgi:hypothetical protein
MMKGWKLVAAVLVLALALVACSDDGGDGGGDGIDIGGGDDGGQTDTVAPEEYVRSLCTGIGTYLDDINALSDDFVGALDPTADAQSQKDAVVGLLNDIIGATDTLITDLEAAGIPDVDDGDAIVAAVGDSFEQARQVIDDARAAVEELSVDDPATFAAELAEIGTAIQNSSAGISASLGTLESEELSEAALDEPACTELAGSGVS